MNKKTIRHYELNVSRCYVKFSKTEVFETDVPVPSIIHSESFDEFKTLLTEYIKEMAFERFEYKDRSIITESPMLKIIYSITAISVDDCDEEYVKLNKKESDEIQEIIHRLFVNIYPT